MAAMSYPPTTPSIGTWSQAGLGGQLHLLDTTIEDETKHRFERLSQMVQNEKKALPIVHSNITMITMRVSL